MKLVSKCCFTSLFITFLFSYSCKKDHKIEGESINAEDVITGDLRNMLISYPDTVAISLDIDLNTDGESDIRLKNVITGSPGLAAIHYLPLSA